MHGESGKKPNNEKRLGTKPRKRFKLLKIFLLVLSIIITVAASGLGFYTYQNMNYDKKPLRKHIMLGM